MIVTFNGRVTELELSAKGYVPLKPLLCLGLPTRKAEQLMLRNSMSQSIHVSNLNRLHRLNSWCLTKEEYDYLVVVSESKFDSEQVDLVRPRYIYVLGLSGVQGLYKVGISYAPVVRARQLQTGNPFKLNILYTTRANKPFEVEKKIHSALKKHHVKGEWFRYLGDIVAKVKSIINGVDLVLPAPTNDIASILDAHVRLCAAMFAVGQEKQNASEL